MLVFAIHQCELATSIHASHTSWTPLPPPSLPYPSGFSQSTEFGCPASCIKFILVIYFIYGNVHVSMLFSQIIPPLPSPTESKSLFFTSVSPLLSFMASVTVCSDFRAQENKISHCFHFFPFLFAIQTTWYSLYLIQAGIKIAGRNVNNLRYADDTSLMADSKEELKSLLLRMKEESEKAGLKFNIKKLRSWYLFPTLTGK